MATLNWSYRPNTPNKYGISIQNTADDVKPNNAAYIALWGNDLTGNGSRQKPWRTLNYAIGAGQNTSWYLIVGAGVYREFISNGANFYQIVGDGDVVFEFSYHQNWCAYPSANGVSISFYNIKFIGNGFNRVINARYTDCVFTMASPNTDVGNTQLKDSVVQDVINGKIMIYGSLNNEANNNTFAKCNWVHLNSDGTASAFYRSLIFYKCNISAFSFKELANLQYCVFHQCNFKLTPGSVAIPGNLYPELPAEYVYFDNIGDLRQALIDSAMLSGISLSNPLYNCLISDPKFNNEPIGDYSLAFDSPAKNRSYFGTYVGAKSIGYPIKARTVPADGDFDLSTNDNLNISDDNIGLANPDQEASIESTVIANIIARELKEAPIYGFYADRNGNYLDTIEDLSSTTISAGTNLNATTPYMVENAAIIYNGAVIQPGERFTTGTILTFTTDSGGTCREIIEAPQRHTIMARFNDGRTVVTIGDSLTVGHWYYSFGTITYQGVEYTNSVFKATTATTFTGTGNVVLAMGDDEYQHYEPGIKFSSNNVGNVRTGDILRGNGDPAYERGPGKEFPLNARFIQVKYMIKVNNLKP